MLEKLFEKRSETLVSDWFEIFSAGTTTKSGVKVSQEGSLEISTVYACVDILSKNVAKLPVQVFKNDGDHKTKERTHEVSRLLKRPNPFMGSFTFKQTMELHRSLWGNAYAEIEFNRAGKPVALWILNPKDTKPYFDIKTKTLWYETFIDGKQFILHSDQVLHLKNMSLDGFVGMSTIRIARETLGTAKAMKDFQASFYKSGTTTKGILKVPQQIDGGAKDIIREEWQRINGGLDNASRIAVLDGGLDFQSISMPLEDAQFIQSMKFSIAEIARIFSVPLHMLAELDKATFSNIEQQSLEFVNNTLNSLIVSWEEELDYKLFTELEQLAYYVKYNLTSLLRGDSESRANYYDKMQKNGNFSINDVRRLEDMNPIEGGNGHYVMLNMADVENIDTIQLAKVKALKGGEKE